MFIEPKAETPELEAPLVEFLAEAGSAGEVDSSGSFTTTGREVVEKIGSCLLETPTTWILLLVQAANGWQAERLSFTFPEGKIRIEFKKVGDRRDWLEAFVPQLQSGVPSQDRELELFQKALWSALAHCRGSAVLVASASVDEESPRAVRLGLDSSQWGSARLAPDSFLIQLMPESEQYLDTWGEELLHQLDRFCCSDRTLVLCGRECKAFLPISPRRSNSQESKEGGLALGLWAHSAESETDAIPLGKSFSQLDASGMKRQELTFGTFRVGRLGRGDKTFARSVIAFTHHSQTVPSRVVWLWQGTEVAHHALKWEAQELCLTLYLEAPVDLVWDMSHRCFRWEERLGEKLDQATKDIEPALQAMIEEYNNYTPRIEAQTLGCWFLLGLCCLALAGLSAPILGSTLALIFGSILAATLMRAEIQFRYKKRYLIGKSLELLVKTLEERKGRRLWCETRLLPNGESYPEESS